MQEKKKTANQGWTAKSFRGHKQLAKAISVAKRSSGERLTVEQLAEKASLSSRHLARLFSKELQMRPAQFLEALRVRTAMHRLEQTDDSVAKIAKDCGFGSRASLYRSFDRLVDMYPAEYRTRNTKRRSEPSGGGAVEGAETDTGSDPEGSLYIDTQDCTDIAV
jgi:transcriptional regulator GlxA family with amidase domain